MRKFVSAFLACSMLLGTIPIASAAENETSKAAVSGYVSAESGAFTLYDGENAPTIYVDGNDFTGVIRAVGDLKSDLKSVTDAEAVITNTIEKNDIAGNSGITIGEDGMSISFDFPVDGDADAFIAAYNSDGTLNRIAMASGTFGGDNFSDGSVSGFNFDKIIEKPSGGKIKGYVWKDMQPVSDVLGMAYDEAVNLEGIDVVVGTIGESEAVDNLILQNAIDVSDIEGKWESFKITTVDGTLVIAGSDKRGTIYGVYDLCEKIGVSPWTFWADTQVGYADKLFINLDGGEYTEGEPSVKYRGIFLNDEFNLSEWSKSMGNTGKNMNNETYEKIFELLLRLKANYLWPAMHTYSTAFNVTENNARLADEYGIVMGSSHCEPLLRNNLGELYDYQQTWQAENPDKTLYINTTDDAKRSVSYMWTDKDDSGNAVDNKEFLTDYWKARAAANGDYENTYTLGMRGVHDGKFSTNMNSQTAMSEIIAAQTQILTDMASEKGLEISDIPQVFIPYKEMLDLYNNGLQIPDYVTLMWTDDNFGYIRQLPTDSERERSGGAGIYYHLSYYGRPTAYLWLGTTQPGLIREEMTKAYDMGAKEIWVANVGDLKPAETEIEYFLDLARDVDNVRNQSIGDRLAENAKRDFGFDDVQAREYADIKLKYYELANSRRPEHMTSGLFSAEFGDEGQKFLDSYADIEKRADVLYNSLDESRKPSLYELLVYPVKGSANMARKYIYSDLANKYADNGRGSAANKYAQMSDEAYNAIISDTAIYTSMLDGKWDKMMNPYQTQLKGSFGGPISGKLSNPTVSELPYTSMAVIPEGGEQIGEYGTGELSFTKYSTEPKYIDLINTGTGSFEWTAESSAEWINITKTSGTVADNDRIYISIDTSKVNPDTTAIGKNVGTITLKQTIGGNDVNIRTINVTVNAVPTGELGEKTYVESDGYVSIEAEHFTASVKNGDYEWKIEEDFGRSGDSVKIYPNLAKNVTAPNMQNSAYLEYNVYFDSEGTFPIELYRMPTINELSGSTMRCRVGIDDATPVQFNGTTKTTDNSTGADSWGKGVLQNTEILAGKITVPSRGLHTIRLYNESAGFVLDKMVITTGEKKTSYFGAPESYNTTYNNRMKALPEATTPSTEQTGDITALFTPSAMISFVASDSVSVVKLADTSEEYILAEAGYDKDGNMTDATFTPFDFTDTEANGIKKITRTPISGDNTANIQYMILKDMGDYLVPVAMSVMTTVSDTTLMASYDSGYVYPNVNMKDYIGKETLCVIYENGSADTNAIRYIRQNTAKEDLYNKILFGGSGKYTLKISISGENEPICEEFSTIVNISADTDAVTTKLYSQNFDTEPSDGYVTITSPAAYESANKAVNAGAGGTISVDFADSITSTQGETVTIVSKIAHGKENGKYMNYAIVDSNGKEIVATHISAYNGGNSTHTIKIGDTNVYESTGTLLAAIARNNSALSAGYTTFTTVIDYSLNKVEVTLESAKGTSTFEGKLPEGTAYDIKQILFTNDYTNTSRTCYVDDISVSKTKASSYTMMFDVNVAGAKIVVVDHVTGTQIAPEADGTYKLCDGLYDYTVTADGYTTVTKQLELSPATESKTVTVVMTAE